MEQQGIPVKFFCPLCLVFSTKNKNFIHEELKMQQKKTTIPMMSRVKLKVKLIGWVLVWIAGLLMAGSDGPWMPYLNIMGLLLFLGACVGLGRVLPALELHGPVSPDPYLPRVQPLKTSSKPMGIRPRYARELGVV
ncbi:MAG: hypothetical protein HUK40_23140 [Desulfobacter sp.]|nr:hypothetical protein [Desulfobacter sp.]